METDLKYIFKNNLDLSGWRHIRTRDNYEYEGTPIPRLRQEVYHKVIEDLAISVGVFYYNDLLAYIAWGPKDSPHCAYHAVTSPEGEILEVRNGCPDIILSKDGAELTVGFKLNCQIN